jgi:hypothetical protein
MLVVLEAKFANVYRAHKLGGHRSCQVGRALAPIAPHAVLTIRVRAMAIEPYRAHGNSTAGKSAA